MVLLSNGTRSLSRLDRRPSQRSIGEAERDGPLVTLGRGQQMRLCVCVCVCVSLSLCIQETERTRLMSACQSPESLPSPRGRRPDTPAAPSRLPLQPRQRPSKALPGPLPLKPPSPFHTRLRPRRMARRGATPALYLTPCPCRNLAFPQGRFATIKKRCLPTRASSRRARLTLRETVSTSSHTLR